MFFEFKTEGQTFRINPEPTKLTGAELLAVEHHTGMGMLDFVEALKKPRGSTAAIMALVWLARRRAGDFVKWAEFAETFHPLTLEMDVIADEPAAEEPVEPAKPAAPKPRSRARAKAS